MKLRSLFATLSAALLIAVAIASPAQNVAHAQQTACADLTCDKATLVDMKPALLGGSEDFKWSSSENISDFVGVTVDPTSSRVTKIDLSSQSIQNATIPADIGKLSELTELFLNDNDYTGSIPSQIGDLTKLTHLHLQNNKLTGSIPAKLGNLSKLIQLRLYVNELSGAIPPALGNLSALEVMFLRENKLTGSIPPELGNLSNLQFLSLNENELTGSIPAELGNLSKLIQLRLTENELSGEIPPALGKLSALHVMFLEENDLSGEIPPALGDLSKLQQLRLRNTDLTGSIPAELGKLTNLTHLLLDKNKLTGSIPTDLGNLTNLDYLYLHNNNLTGPVPDSLANLINLLDLFISGNDFICVPTSLYTSLASFAVHLKDLNTLDDNSTGEAQLRDCQDIPDIRRIEPDPASATAEPGDELTLSVKIFNHQNVQDQSLATGVTFAWSSTEAGASITGTGPSITYTAPSTLGTYTVTASLDTNECVGNNSNDCTATFQVTVATPPILRIEPVVEAVVLSAGEHVRLKVDIYGLQDIHDQSLGDDVTFDWKTSTGSVPQNSTGAHVVYTASTTAGSDTATVSLGKYECTGTDTERSDCSAEFQITVRRPSPAPAATPEPQNPAGSIPSALGTLDGRTCEVFTPEAGGTFRGDGFSFSAGPASVQNGEYIAICMEQSGSAEANRSPEHRYTLYGSTFDIAAYDAEGNQIVHYALNSPADACIPLPPAIRSRIDDISMVSVNPEDIALTARSSSLKNPADISLTAHSSSLRLHSDGDFRICGTLATLPITVAAASLGPPQTPTPEPTPEPTAVPPDTGGSAPSQSPLILALILALLTMSIGAYILLTPRNKTR